MLVLMPDAQFEDDAQIEREVLGGVADVVVHRERIAERIQSDDWGGADALIVYYGVPVDRPLVERLDSLSHHGGPGWVTTTSTSPRARSAGFRCNVPDYGTTEVADHAIALTLALARGWSRTTPASWPIRSPAGIGWARRWCAGCAAAPSASSGSAASVPRPAAAQAPWTWRCASMIPTCPTARSSLTAGASLHALLAAADVISLHCPLTEHNRHMIDAVALAAIKPGTLLINTARGAWSISPRSRRRCAMASWVARDLDVLPDEPPDPEHSLVQAFRRREPGSTGASC